MNATIHQINQLYTRITFLGHASQSTTSRIVHIYLMVRHNIKSVLNFGQSIRGNALHLLQRSQRFTQFTRIRWGYHCCIKAAVASVNRTAVVCHTNRAAAVASQAVNRTAAVFHIVTLKRPKKSRQTFWSQNCSTIQNGQ